MRQLKLTDGDPIWLQFITNKLKKATFAKIKPILLKRVLSNIDNYNIKEMRRVLETQLIKYHCLTVGDEIAIKVEFN